jgi:hypothetical protein
MSTTKLLSILALSTLALACGDDDGVSPDAGPMTGNDAGGGADPDPTCDNYCNLVMSSCSGEYAQYPDLATCMNYCTAVGEWDPGTRGDTSGNSIACRIYHANAPSIANPALHCYHAGATGGNMCGTWCENYCDVLETTCRGSDQVFASPAECMTACAAYPTDGLAGDTAGDSVQCRLYHAGIPAAMSPDTHCPHTAPDGGGVCVFDAMGFDFRTDAVEAFTRVDRMGMPAVSTALVANKNTYNDGDPDDDAALMFATELLTNLGGLHTALDDDIEDASLTPCSMAPPSAGALPPCVAQSVVAGGPTVVSLVVPDTLKIDPTMPAGFPNGRALADPVIDVTLAVILLDMTTHNPGTLAGLPLNPAANDREFSATFPYLAAPH